MPYLPERTLNTGRACISCHGDRAAVHAARPDGRGVVVTLRCPDCGQDWHERRSRLFQEPRRCAECGNAEASVTCVEFRGGAKRVSFRCPDCWHTWREEHAASSPIGSFSLLT
jgi:predicted RNA-binding Zn-ribbon protein involved in translation (DUF1610 family)